jgi:DNA polymerase-1
MADRPLSAGRTWQTAAFVIDLSTWAHRAWHAIGRDRASGASIDMLPAAASMLVKLLAEKAPAWLVAAADVGGRTWRHELYPAYKGERPPHPEGFDRQLAEIARLLELHRIPVLGAAGHEADDVIAALVRRFRRAGVPVVILGADKDLRQLVTDQWPGVVMWDGKDKITTAHAIRDEWGIEPDRIGDLLALTGDDGDGVPGLRGVGPKKAAEMLRDSRDLEHAIGLRQWGSTAAAKALRAGMDQVRLARRLVALRDDVPIAVELEACALGGYDIEGLRAWYGAHGLTRLTARMDEAPAKRSVDEAMAAAWRGGGG